MIKPPIYGALDALFLRSYYISNVMAQSSSKIFSKKDTCSKVAVVSHFRHARTKRIARVEAWSVRQIKLK